MHNDDPSIMNLAWSNEKTTFDARASQTKQN
jgi:hypothetical protein